MSMMRVHQSCFQAMLYSVCLIFSSCIGTARLTDLPKSAADVDFTKYSDEMNKNKTPFWTFETANEYYIEKSQTVNDTVLFSIIEKALVEKGYKIKSSDRENKAVIAKRGLRFNEWSSVTGVYYNISADKTQIYISTHITQDATGGVRNNIAKKVGLIIESNL